MKNPINNSNFSLLLFDYLTKYNIITIIIKFKTTISLSVFWEPSSWILRIAMITIRVFSCSHNNNPTLVETCSLNKVS